MKRYVLTGTPGAGKTTLLRHLRALGYPTVDEAATDVIAAELAAGTPEPWTREDFVDKIVALQRRRQVEGTVVEGAVVEGAVRVGGAVQFFDRSPVCTHALSVWLGREPTGLLRSEIDRLLREHVYEPEVFFVGNLGYCEPTAARRISFEDSLAFEAVHRESYEAFGFRLVEIPAASAAERAALVAEALARLADETPGVGTGAGSGVGAG
jgi:predicted ATPase